VRSGCGLLSREAKCPARNGLNQVLNRSTSSAGALMADFQSGLAAKEFFIGRIVASAEREGIPLSDLERRHLYFTEIAPDAKPKYLEDAACFEQEYESNEYEKKICNLLKRAWEHDRKHPQELGVVDARELYRRAYDMLRKEDHYILVMIDEALGSS